MAILMQTRENMKTDSLPSHILGHLRQAAKAYVAYYPGAGIIVDIIFNQIDQTVDLHGEKSWVVINQALSDFFKIVHHGENNHEGHSVLEIFAA